MNLSFNWLNDYIDLSDINVHELADVLTMKTCEVETVFEFNSHLDKIIAGKVTKLEKHPDADKLQICQIDTGGKTIQIVTGAANVAENKIFPVAVVGSVLANGTEMKEAKLRGVESFGMLCSAGEIGIEDIAFDGIENSEEGLMVLPDSFKIGESMRNLLEMNDTIIEIDNKSITHRPDLWGHAGFAREISALLKRPMKYNPFEEKDGGKVKRDEKLLPADVSIEEHSALAYGGAVLTGVKIGASSLKMQSRLLAAGMRPINNAVDVSNYVMLEMGQPNHAFDRDFIKGKINISFSKKGEKVVTLDEKEHIMPEGIVLIRDGQNPIALGGVMGGMGTEVNENTTSIFLESASFHRKDIRKAVSSVGIRTEASQRFEKGQDVKNAEAAIYRFASLMHETCPELVLGKVNVTFDEKPKENIIKTSFSYIKQRLGSINLSDKEIQEIFESLNFKCETRDDDLTVTVPSYRSQFDLTIPDDLVEEIGRIAGYQNVEPLPFMVSCEVPQDKNEFRKLEHRLRKILSDAYQFMEVYNYAFQSEDDIELDRRYAKEPIRMQNSIAADLNCIRISPLTGLLKNVKKNQKEHDSLRFFELERIFVPKDLNNKEGGEESLPDEKHFLSAVWAENEITNEKLVSFASMASDLVFRCGVNYNEQLPERIKEEIFHAGRAGQIKSLKDGKVLLKWGEINPRLLKKAGVKKRVLYFETFVGDLHKSQNGKSHYKRVPKFPAADFECTILTDIKEDFINIANTAGRPDPSKKEGDNTYVENLEYLTEYSGDPIPVGQKAVSLRVTWRNAERTISHDELKNLQEDLVNRLAGTGYKLRS